MIGLIITIAIWLLAFWGVSLILEKVLGKFGVNVSLAKGVGSFAKLLLEVFIKAIGFVFKWLVIEPLRFLLRLLNRGIGGGGDRLY